MTIESKKYQLIEKIFGLQDETVLKKIEILLQEYSKGNTILLDIIKPIKDTINIDELKQTQNYQGFDKAEVDNLIKNIALDEPLEELLDMI